MLNVPFACSVRKGTSPNLSSALKRRPSGFRLTPLNNTWRHCDDCTSAIPVRELHGDFKRVDAYRDMSCCWMPSG